MRARRRVRRVGAMRQSATRSIRGPSLRARACGGARRAGASSRSDVASPAVRTRVPLQSSGWLFIPAERSASRRCKHAMCKRARSVIGDRSHSPIPAAERTGAAAERTASARSRCGRRDDRAAAFGAARASRPPAARRSHGPHSTMTNPVRAACGAHTRQPTVSSASTRIALTRPGEREGVRACGRDHRTHAYRTSGKRMNVACVGSGDDLNRRAQRMDRMAALARCAAQPE